MDLPPLFPATFVRRVNRFRAEVRLPDGTLTAAHVPNSGRLRELFTPGRRVYLRHTARRGRKTAWDMALVQLPSGLVSVDARLPNRLLHEAARVGSLQPWLEPGAWIWRAEPASPGGRLDFCLRHRETGQRLWIETKSITLVEDGIGLFPDAPTARGRRHLLELAERVRAGDRAAVVFVVQRPDARAMAPHTADPDFPRALAQAVAAGVEVYAFACEVNPDHIRLARPLPVLLPP
ncbi:MAG: DNA/RNA nuclease SfsA [Chloroflexi bacterium]|nr:DNA/RNA nuclease SfsA [Chloroflexota bacterium]